MTWILMLAVWGKEVVLRCVWRWDRWCPWYENIGTLIWAPEQGDMFILDSVYNIREGSFEENGSSSWSDASYWHRLLCACALIKGKIFCLTAHHFYVFFRDGKFPLNSGNESNLWYRSNKPRKLWAFESHTELQHKFLRLEAPFRFLWGGKKRTGHLMTSLPAILVSPSLRTQPISKIKVQMFSLHCVQYNELLPASCLELISDDNRLSWSQRLHACTVLGQM